MKATIKNIGNDSMVLTDVGDQLVEEDRIEVGGFSFEVVLIHGSFAKVRPAQIALLQKFRVGQSVEVSF